MSDAKDLQRRMAAIRESLRQDVRGVAENARELTDWRCLVKKHPWVTLGAAAALGFLAVPRRLETTRPDADTLAKLAQRGQLFVQPRAEAQARDTGVIGWLFSFASNMLFRAGITYAGQQVGKIIGGQNDDRGPRDATEASGNGHAMREQHTE